jgi:3-deoxy-D-manno-octulosonate 8-phosphate phosphatase (KDO 8-P phosphatase)
MPPSDFRMTPMNISSALRERFARVQILLCDVDGILTDSTIFVGQGTETKRFCVKDGLGIRLMRESGLKVGWISGRPSQATEQRAQELHIDFLYQSSASKTVAANDLLRQTGLAWEQVGYMGDDLVDLCLLRRAGLAVSVPEAMAEAKALAHYVTQSPGGHGAVREVIELILKAQGRWESIIQKAME